MSGITTSETIRSIRTALCRLVDRLERHRRRDHACTPVRRGHARPVLAPRPGPRRGGSPRATDRRGLCRGRSGPGAPRRQRKIDLECGSAARFAVDSDVAAGLLHDAVAGGQSEARALALLLGREERVEDVGEHVRRDTTAVVRHRHQTVSARDDSRWVDSTRRRAGRRASRSSSRPPEFVASRALTTRLTSTCSNWLRSTRVTSSSGHSEHAELDVLTDQTAGASSRGRRSRH